MTQEEAKRNQDRIAKHYDLGWWYGTHCEKCCGIYPKLMHSGDSAYTKVFYQCEVCGKRTEEKSMPWIAEEAWNAHEFKDEYVQLSLF